MLCCLPWSQAFAQQDELSQLLDLSLEELLRVNVSVASNFDESALNLGSTVALITEKEWQKRGARRLHDAIKHLPSTMVLPSNIGIDAITVRGFAANNNVSGVSTQWDGVPLATLQSGTEVFDRQNINLGVMDRIEMIRGPGSALHGENAFHGVLSLKSFESDIDVGRADVEVGSKGYYQAAVKYSTAVGAGARLNVAGAISGQSAQDIKHDFDDAGTPRTADRDFRYHTNTGVIKWVSDKNQQTYFQAGLYWDDNLSDDFTHRGSDNLGARDLGSSESDFIMTQLAVTHKLSDKSELQARAYYWDKEHRFDFARNATSDIVARAEEYQWGVNATYKQKELFGNTQWSAQLARREAKTRSADQVVNDLDGNLLSQADLAFGGYKRDINSFIIDANSDFFDKQFQVRYGFRIDDYSDFGKQTSPRFGLIYHPEKDSAIKFLYGEAFRAPAGVEINGSVTLEGDTDIKPETIKTYELVYQKEGDNWKTELTFFKSKWEDAIGVTSTTTPGFFGRFDNINENSAKGVEFSYLRSAKKWTFDFSTSYVKSENADTDVEYVAFPEWIINLGIGYHWEKYKTDIFLNNRIHLNAAEGPITNAVTDPDELRTYWRADLNVVRKVNDSLTTFVNVINLFDRRNFLPSIQNSENGIPDEPFSVSAGVRYTF